MANDPSLPTSLDVARRAGVSQSAVSLVFGGRAAGRISKRTQEAILQAAQELGYHPNSGARTLRSGRSRFVLFAIPDVSNPYFASVILGAEQAARQHNYSLMLASVVDEQDWQHVVLDALASQAVAGCMLYGPPPSVLQTNPLVREKAVVIDMPESAYPSIRLDITDGVTTAMQHLFSLGHTRIAHLGAAVDQETFHLRYRTYLAQLQAAGIVVPDAYHEHVPFLIEDAQAAAYRLLTHPEPPSAILCDSDILAVGVYKAATSLQRSIPLDLSVISFDDSIIARILEPELTSIAIPTTLIGEQAFLLLLSVLEGKPVPSSITIPLQLVVRASTQAR